MYKRKKISEDASSFKDDENPISMFFHLLETGTIFFFIQDNFFKENEMLWARVPSRLECKRACMLSRFSRVCLCNTVGCSPPGSFVHGGFSRQEYWRGLPCPPPGDLPNLGIDPRSPTLQAILYQPCHKRSLRILEWVAYPFSSRPFWPRNRTAVSCIAGGFFTNWAMREALDFLNTT